MERNKKCLECGIEFVDTTRFNRMKYCSDYHRKKHCWNRYNEEHREKVNLYARNYYNINKERIRTKEFNEKKNIYLNKWRLENRERFNQIQNIYKKKNPIKNNARNQSNRLHERDNHCHWCNNKENLHFHHTDYIERTGFTLCKQCHKLLHKNMWLGGDCLV